MGLRYNPATGQLEASAQVTPAPSGRMVQIVDLLGDVKQIPESEVTRALAEGAELDSPEKQAERKRKAELGSASGMVKALGAGALRGATLGVSDVAAGAIPGAQSELSALREENPISSLVGEGAGTIAGLFVGPGAAIAKGAAAVGERAAAKFAGEGLARAAVAKAAQAATRGAVEGAAYGAGQGVTEVALADSPRTMGEIAETVIANAGLGAVLGGAVDVGAAGVAGIGKMGVNRLRALVGGADGLTGQAAKDVAALRIDLPESGAVPDELAGVQATRGLERVGSEVSEGAAPEVAQRAFREELGITDVPAGFRGGELEGRAFDYLRQRPQTLAGGLAKQKEAQILEGVTKRMDAVLGKRGATKTPIARADALSMQVLEDLSAVEKPLSKTFQDLRAATQGQAIPDAFIAKAKNGLKALEESAGDLNSPLAKAAREYSARLDGLRNIDGFQSLQTEISDRAFDFAVEKTQKSALREILPIIREAQDDALEALVGPGAQDILREARKGWAEHRATTKEVGELFGFKNVGSTADLERKIADLGPEKLWARVSKTNDINQLQLLRDKYPHLLQEIRDGVVQELVEKATKNGQMMAGPLLESFGPKTWGTRGKWSEEAVKVLFGDAAPKQLRNLQAIYNIRPQLFNPSGTAAAIDFGSFFTPQGFLQELNAASMYAALYGAPMLERAIKDSDSYILKALKNFQEGKGVSGIKAPAISGASQVLGKTFTEQADRVAELATQPERVAEMAAKASTSVGRVMPNASGAVTDITMRAMKLLQEKLPKGPPPEGPLDDQKYEPSPAEKAKWDRYVQAFENPYSVLEDLQKGTITPEAVETLRVVYPDLYGKMTSMAIEQLASGKKAKLSYSQRTALSIFLGQPSDSTMSPSFIAAMQQATRVDEAERSQGGAPRPQKFETNQPKNMMLDSQRILTRGQS